MLLVGLLECVLAAAIGAAVAYLAWHGGITLERMQGLLTPLIAAIAAYIAWQQWLTNRQKLDLDLYDRRLRVYQAVFGFISKALWQPSAMDFERHVVDEFVASVAESDFLFGPEVTDYLRELVGQLVKLRQLQEESTGFRSQSREMDDRLAAGEQARELTDWFRSQYEASKKIFMKYLNVSRR